MAKGYYVTVIRELGMRSGRKVGWLLGPYPTHDEALANVSRGRRIASEIDPRTSFDAFGTSSIEIERGELPLGVLNANGTPLRGPSS